MIGDRSIATKGYANQEHDWIWYIPLPAPIPDDAEVMMSTGDNCLPAASESSRCCGATTGSGRCTASATTGCPTVPGRSSQMVEDLKDLVPGER